MKIERFDHIVISTADLTACVDFYTRVLGMEHRENNGRHALYFGGQKINVHVGKAQFLPAARNPEFGSADFCLITTEPAERVKAEIEAKGWPVELGVVPRTGARGPIRSVYVRDPDGNLVEIAEYPREGLLR